MTAPDATLDSDPDEDPDEDPDGALDGVDPASPVGTIAGTRWRGRAFAAVRATGGWVLVPDECPHAACAFSRDGEVFDDAVLSCVCHGSEFDLATGALRLGPAQTGLAVVALTERGGRLYPPAGTAGGTSGGSPVR